MRNECLTWNELCWWNCLVLNWLLALASSSCMQCLLKSSVIIWFFGSISHFSEQESASQFYCKCSGPVLKFRKCHKYSSANEFFCWKFMFPWPVVFHGTRESRKTTNEISFMLSVLAFHGSCVMPPILILLSAFWCLLSAFSCLHALYCLAAIARRMVIIFQCLHLDNGNTLYVSMAFCISALCWICGHVWLSMRITGLLATIHGHWLRFLWFEYGRYIAACLVILLVICLFLELVTIFNNFLPFLTNVCNF